MLPQVLKTLDYLEPINLGRNLSPKRIILVNSW